MARYATNHPGKRGRALFSFALYRLDCVSGRASRVARAVAGVVLGAGFWPRSIRLLLLTPRVCVVPYTPYAGGARPLNVLIKTWMADGL